MATPLSQEVPELLAASRLRADWQILAEWARFYKVADMPEVRLGQDGSTTLEHQRLRLKLLLEDGARNIQDFEYLRHGDRVPHARAFTPRAYQPLASQRTQMLRHIGGLSTHPLVNLVDGEAARFSKHLKDTDAYRVREDSEEIGFEILQCGCHFLLISCLREQLLSLGLLC